MNQLITLLIAGGAFYLFVWGINQTKTPEPIKSIAIIVALGLALIFVFGSPGFLIIKS